MLGARHQTCLSAIDRGPKFFGPISAVARSPNDQRRRGKRERLQASHSYSVSVSWNLHVFVQTCWVSVFVHALDR